MNELRIKSAAEYRREEVTVETAAQEDLTAKVVEFINNTVTPKIEDKVANPGKYTTNRKNVSFPCPYPTAPFIAEAKRLLEPRGFKVYESHDGGGMYATIEIDWEAPAVKPERTIGRRFSGR